MCVLIADEGCGGPVLLGLPRYEELLRLARGLRKNQGLHRRGGRDRTGRPILFRAADARGSQIRSCRIVGRQEYGNYEDAALKLLRVTFCQTLV